jgi:radical SAM protein with 4Fe4S-binding SPASM domain
MRRNVRDLPELVRLAAAWGVDGVWVQNLSHTFSDTDPAGAYGGIREFAAAEALWGEHRALRDEVFGEAEALAGELGVELRVPRLEGRPERRRPGAPGCTWPWDAAYVTHRGAVQPCCMVMGADRVALGQLEDEPFADIWHGEPYRAFRAGLASDGDPPEVCRGCALYQGVF